MLAVIGGLILYVANLFIVQRDHFMACRGEPYEITQSSNEAHSDGSIDTDIRLKSGCGVQVRIRALIPLEARTKRVPLLLLIGGHRTGRNAVDIVENADGIAYAAIDYPYDGSQSLSGALQIIAAMPGIQSAFLDTPRALMLATDWLADQHWFDPERAELAGVSLGVPFAAATGALDRRFSRIWLIHGATDNYEWLMHAAQDRLQNRLLRTITVRASLLLVHGNSFKTAEWIRDMAPRPTVLIAASQDESMSPGALDSLTEIAKGEHVSLVWTQGRHVDPDREYEIRQLMDLVAAEIKVSSAGADSGIDMPMTPNRKRLQVGGP